MLHIYDTLTKTKKEFVPVSPSQVNFYYCGITVYGPCHIGHARTWVAFDVMHRYLKFKGYNVNLVRNITDIDDKIINKANERGISAIEVAEENIEGMHRDLDALNILPVTHEPRATETIAEMWQMIEQLIAAGHAYVGASGDVYFEVATYDKYGELGHKDLDALVSGARVEAASDKRSPLDFVLFKCAKPGEPAWDSPWGKGRPGWHIECSAMAAKYCATTLDIHGGGADLPFPHHENERAQSECTHGQTFVNTWTHVGFVQMNAEKMSKSLGNIAMITDVLEDWHPEVLRYFLMSRHYRSPIDFTDKGMSEARSALSTLYNALKVVPPLSIASDTSGVQFSEKMDDDFNTPEALAVLFDLASRVQTTKDAALAAELKALGGALGILEDEPNAFLQFGKTLDTAEIEALITARNVAKAAKDWAKADAIRDELKGKGVVLEDGAGGTTWRVI